MRVFLCLYVCIDALYACLLYAIMRKIVRRSNLYSHLVSFGITK